MGSSIFVSILLTVLLYSTMAEEKVLSRDPSAISAEKKERNYTDLVRDVKSKSGGRSARLFSFPKQQDSRTRQSNFDMSSFYNSTHDRHNPGASTAAAVEDEIRPVNFRSFSGHGGTQMALNFKRPFLSVLNEKMNSTLSSSPLGGIFGTYSPPFGSASESPLSNFLLGFGSPLSHGMATAGAVTIAAFLYPKVRNLLDGTGLNFRDGRAAHNFIYKMGRVLAQFINNTESCMKVAFCSLEKAKKQEKFKGLDPSGDSTYADVLEDILNLSSVENLLKKVGLSQARNLGISGGNCDYFNIKKKCPIGMDTFSKYLSNLGLIKEEVLKKILHKEDNLSL